MPAVKPAQNGEDGYPFGSYPFDSGDRPAGASHEHIMALHLKRLLDADIKRVLARHSDLSLPQWRMISVLSRSERAVSQKELVSRTYITQAQASRALFALQNDGLVIASQSKTDRRSWDYSISAKGRAAFQVLLPHMEERREALDAALTPDERHQFLVLMQKIAAVARRRQDED